LAGQGGIQPGTPAASYRARAAALRRCVKNDERAADDAELAEVERLLAEERARLRGGEK
jgi:hypothetical protein